MGRLPIEDMLAYVLIGLVYLFYLFVYVFLASAMIVGTGEQVHWLLRQRWPKISRRKSYAVGMVTLLVLIVGAGLLGDAFFNSSE